MTPVLLVRVAAVFTLKQLRGEKSHPALLVLSEDDDVREYALRAIADRKGQLEISDIGPLANALKDANPRVRVVAARAIGRFASTAVSSADSADLMKQAIEANLSRGPPIRDPIVVHICHPGHSLVKLNCSGRLKPTSGGTRFAKPLEPVRIGATMVLRHLHDPADRSIGAFGLVAA